MTFFLYALNYALLFSCLFDLGVKAPRRFSFGLVRIFFLIPLLVVEYLYFGAQMQSSVVASLFFSEIVFGLTWIGLAYNLTHAIYPDVKNPMPYRLATIAGISSIFCVGSYWLLNQPVFKISDNDLILPYHGQLYFSSLFVLMAVLVMAWRAEAFWRTVNRKERNQYKYLLIGVFLISGSLGWASSFRIAYLYLTGDHLLLLAILLLTAWLLMAYAVARHRLLNRKIFVSRKVVYSTIAPIAFACYLIALGIISLLMRTLGWTLGSVLQWLLIIAGLLLIIIFALSDRFRAKVKFFISTHFYVNKYEYRDEWLAFSNLLQDKLTEAGVVDALRQILQESLYTETIKIWLGDTKTGFRLIAAESSHTGSADDLIAADDPLINYLQNAPYVDRNTHISDPVQSTPGEKNGFFADSGLSLLVPLNIGDQCVGLIGLGPEYTGGTYGPDDFDLLAALGSQAASALLAVRMAEELARTREQSVWDTLSAFVLHDIKNAATMLSLVKENATLHINNPEFQQDMLASVDDALKRMAKVQGRLNTLKGEIVPLIKEVNICKLLRDFSHNLARKMPELIIDVQCKDDLRIRTDPEFIAIMLENLALNSLEANSGRARLRIKIEERQPEGVCIEFSDNGPGIPSEMLPDRLFEPFATEKPKGNGIGLWQVKRLIEGLKGKIEAQNIEDGGARFLLRFP